MSESEVCLERAVGVAIGARNDSRWQEFLGRLYCRAFHRSLSRPVHGRYRCWECLREFEVGW